MGYHPRIETAEFADFLTTRTRNSELWFVNNKALEQAILGYLAKYATRYKVTLYAFAIEGNHFQAPVQFHHGNRKDFMRDLKSSTARAIPRYSTSYRGGTFWGRRYSNEFLPGTDDIENWFFYTVLQPVQDGLVEKIKDYPGYNCFHDAIWGIKRKYSVMNWTKYYEAKRYKKNVKKIDYLEVYTLEYARLPGYEHLSQKEYAHLMMKKLEERRRKIVADRYATGKGFTGRAALKKTPQGSIPKSTKTSTATSHRPRILCVCPIRRSEALAWYFSIYFHYKEASKAYRAGNFSVSFPPGTYKPMLH
jgi:hypothetical protein